MQSQQPSLALGSSQTLEIDIDLYNKLLRCGIFRANPKVKMLFDKKKTALDTETSQLLENGVALGKYLLVLKDALRRNNQDLNVDPIKMGTMKTLNNAQTKLYNWNIITQELDKVGISIDTDTKSLIVAGDQEQILTIFMRIERFLTKIVGKQVLNLDGLKSDVQMSNAPSDPTGGDKSNARRGAKPPNQKKRIAKEGVDILSMNQEREPHETESSLELILNTLCRAFQMKPKQAAALLTNNNQFLIHSIVKGVKGRFEPLLTWYQDLYAHSKHLTGLLEAEMEQFPQSANCSKLLATLSCGLYSNNLDIAKWCLKLLTKVGYDFAQNQIMFDQALKWFLEKEGGLELSLHCLKKNPDLAEDFVGFVGQFSAINDQIEQVYKVELKKYFSSPLEYVNAINDLFPFLVAQNFSEVQKSGILDFWVESSIRQADNDGKHSYDERIAALTLLAEVWLSYTQYIDSREEIATQVLNMLKRASRDKHKPLRMIALALMFRLLDKFAEDKNQSAPAVYKTLIFSMVENPNDSVIRELYYINFMSLFDSHSSIPVNLLIDPLIKQIQVTEGVTFHFKIFDFEFFNFAAKHPKLSGVNAIPMADLLAKIYLNEVTYSSAACVPFIQLVSRFIHSEAMQEFIIKFVTIGFSMLMGLEKNAEELQFKHQQLMIAQEKGPQKNGKKILALPAPPQHQPRKISGKKMTKDEKLRKLKEQDEDVVRRLKKTHIVELTLKIQNLKNEDLNDQLREMLLSTNKRFNELYGYFNKGLMALLRWWGEPDQIMGSYIRAIEEKEQREREEKERREQLEKEKKQREIEEKERKEKDERERRLKEYEEKMKQLSQSAANGEYMNEEDRRMMIGYDSADNLHRAEDGSLMPFKPNSVRNSMAVLPYTGGISGIKNLKNAKAMQQIEKIKRNKLEKEEQKRLEDERRKLQSARKNKKLKETLDKRKIELGIMPKANATTDVSKALIYKDGSIDQDQQKLKQLMAKMMVPQIQLLNLDEEEERDKEAVLSYMKKYSKLWKNLYYKYANSGFSSKQISNFDQLNEKLQTMNFSEMTKLLKDHGVFPTLINKDELTTLFRLINQKLFNRSDLQALDYPGYSAFIMQLAYYCYSRPPKDLSHLPPVESMRALVAQFEQATRSRGQSTVLYDDPDITSMADQQLIKALNEKLRQDPTYPIPEGYFKQVEKTPIYEYRIPDNIVYQLPEANVCAVELMDELLNNLFGIHILEPLITFDERLKVRPSIKAQIKPQAEALNYMKRVEKKRGNEGGNSLNPYASLNQLEKIKVNQEIKPQLSIPIKLEVAQYPLKERPQVQEVAEFLEEMFQAVEKGLDFLPPRPNRAPGQVWNDAKQKKNDDVVKEIETKNLREDLRKRRDEQVKIQLQQTREQKMKDLEEQREGRLEKERQEQEAQKRKLESQKTKLENKKKEIEEIKAQKFSDIQSKKEEESEKQRELEEKKKRERAEFMKKQKQKLGQEFDQIKKEREDVLIKQDELKKKEQEYQQRIRNQMENFIKEHQEDKGKEQKERLAINEFLKQGDVEQTLSLYDKSLKHMFKFYASQDKKDLDFNLERSMNTMNFREFIRFCYQQMIIPTLLQPDDAVSIFRQLIRERIEELSGQVAENYLSDKTFAQVLDFEYFKKALMRIAIMAQDALGAQNSDLLLAKLDKETKSKEEERKKKEKLRKAVQDKSKAEKEALESMREEFKQTLGKSPSKTLKKGTITEEKEYEINHQAVEKEDAFFEKWMKQREAQGISLKKRIIGQEKGGTLKKTISKKKVTIKGADQEEDDGVREGEDIEGTAEHTNGQTTTGLSKNGTLSRKTREVKKLKELAEQEAQKEQLASTKIENKRIRKDLDVAIISAKTIEALLKFLEIEPDDSIYLLDKKLNQHRIEIQGQKPTKFKKQLKPNSNLIVINKNLELDDIKEGTVKKASEENENQEEVQQEENEEVQE